MCVSVLCWGGHRHAHVCAHTCTHRYMHTHVQTHGMLNDFENGEGRRETILIFQAKLYQVKFQAGFGHLAPMTTTGSRPFRLPSELALEGARAASWHSRGGPRRPHATSEAAREALSGSRLRGPALATSRLCSLVSALLPPGNPHASRPQMSPQADEGRPCDSGPPRDHASASVSPALRWEERPTQVGVTPGGPGATLGAHGINQGEVCSAPSL